MARRTPQSRFDIAHLLLDHASIEHENENRFCSKDDASVRVENRGTGFAAKWSVGECGDVKVRANWRNRGSEWDYALARFNLHSCPHIPTHSNFVDSLWICVCHFRHVCRHVFFLFLFYSFFVYFSFNYENYY